MRQGIIGVLICAGLCFGSVVTQAQVVHQELLETVPAVVTAILDEEERDIIGTDTIALVQLVSVEVERGERAGKRAVFETDLVELEVGDRIFVNRLMGIDGVEYYQFKDVDRRSSLGFLLALFVGLLAYIGGKQGMRALVALGMSIAALFLILVPLLLRGYPPVATSVGVAGVVLALVLFVTHGINGRSVTAFFGTFGAIVLTGILAFVFVPLAHLTGLSSDASIYLNFGTEGRLDFGGLLLGSILIGVLGVLDDVAITQASVVCELVRANAALSARELYARAIRVGRDHIGSLVNTLALAYIGVSLPLVMLLVQSDAGLTLSVNQEMVASELIRILIGSIGLILAVPLTTAVAAYWFSKHRESALSEGDAIHTHLH